MGFRRVATLFPLTALGMIAIVWSAAGGSMSAQDVLPTPRGQLGGRPPLQTAPPQAEQTPAPTPDDEDEDVPDPSECEVAPRTIDELSDLAATPLPATEPSDVATPADLASGEPANPLISNAVAYTVREAVACSNAGEWLRVLALYSDGNLQRTAAALGGFDEEFLRRFASPQPTRHDEMPLVTDVVLLPDGRAAAWVVPDEEEAVFALSSLEGRLRVVFVAVEGRWLVDEIHAPGFSAVIQTDRIRE